VTTAHIKTIEAVLFDLDGTLVDTAVKIGEVLSTMRQRRGLEDVDLKLVRRTVSLGAEALIQTCLGEALVDVAADLREFRSRLTATPSGVEDIYPGVVGALEALAPRVALAVVTNKPESLARALLDGLGITQRFAVIVGGDTAAARKPSPAPITYALTALGCIPEQAIMVGDSDLDAAASTAAGCRFALFTEGYGTATHAAKAPEFEFASFGELLSKVLPFTPTERPTLHEHAG
jgi:phosphoglycolate phosphatase